MGRFTRSIALTFLALGALHASADARPGDAHRPVLIRVAPDYPELARRMHVCGNVVLVVQILPDGTVGDAHAESGHALLRQAAEQAVRRWRFASGPPATVSVAVSFAAPAN